MKTIKIKVTPELVLRSTVTTDAVDLFRLIDDNRDQLKKWMPWEPLTKTIKDELAFIQVSQMKVRKNQLVLLTIEYMGHVAGMIDIHSINPSLAQGEIGYWLGKDFQHQHLMQQVVNALSIYAFTNLNMHRLNLYTDVENQASHHVALNAGFKEEGRLVEYLKDASGQFHDALIHGRVNHN
ncbi:GNAT family N-acetyltransferase [Periweissella beninensis]|uniref:GNAT family N-acetyltransferase n=1 Tax=Periweissella beninensis TaxID=504936 RepID=UPI0021A4D659|nr:GNAT family protein [Periweissella beninensis]MCT4395500.1 N-acetyltransferase [Periweissella beninensis]